MPTPFHSRPIRSASAYQTARATGSAADWRCTGCGKLLGIRRDGLMHLSFARGHEYLVSYPATATCRGCGTLNQATARAR
ncbi:hypothetical protein H5395_17425 [Paracoccus sp. MC1854]|uniref:hypothetical protein n=1 Tax=Paracoccus sp. MC1854 TaxID=2760306 RepID=UPI001601B06D|nr:hypothetical protein [Paracoccus sp. MC1854]MBB1493238.1 hypothetical protein [Paracoccus sp. MC1854]